MTGASSSAPCCGDSRAAPALALGVRVGDSTYGRAIAAAAVAEGVDYVSVALGESSSYLGSVGIVPPAPVLEVVAEHASAFRPRATGHRHLAHRRPRTRGGAPRAGVADAVGMTRALIADPELPAKAFAERARSILVCIGCNACIAHYHAGTLIGCTVNPRTGPSVTVPRRARPRASRRGRGGGPAGLQAAAEAAELGHDVVLLERGDRLGGQLLLAERSPGRSGDGESFPRLLDRRVTEAESASTLHRGHSRRGRGARPGRRHRRHGGRTSRPDLPLAESRPSARDLLAGEVPTGRRRRRRLGRRPVRSRRRRAPRRGGNAVTLAVASVTVGEMVHQYRRNLYLQRLYRAGVRSPPPRLLGGRGEGAVELGNVFAREPPRARRGGSPRARPGSSP